VCLVDTDGDPDLVDIPVPGNDDSMRTIDIIIREMCDAVTKGKEGRATSAGESPVGDAPRDGGRDGGRDGRDGGRDGGAPRRRSSRSQFRAGEAAAAPASGEGA
jgi:small subunit ribosomal protein S2